ncbi:MAG: hypothetical protein SNI45_00610 [Rikenellaceae bacterium]
MNKFSFYFTLLTAVAILVSPSCSSDSVSASITLSQQAIFFSQLGESQVITFTGSNIDTLEVDEDDIPDGWEITIKKSSKKITVYGPTTQEDFDNSLTSSSITFTATSEDDLTGSDYLTVGTTNSYIDLSSEQSNCYAVTEPGAIYSFNGTLIAESSQTISPDYVEILWQTYPAPLSYARLLDDNTVEFHVTVDEDDYDEDGYSDDLFKGNALIAAYDSDDNVLWSWHIWITENDIETTSVTLNDIEIMGYNLGSFTNSTLSETTILESYGLYYQWGRKDPFVGPYYYNAAGATDKTMRNEYGTTVTISYCQTNPIMGRVSYTIANPLTYLMGVEESNYDWLYAESNDDLWSETKGIYDPCPKGWRVASPELYEGLMVPTMSQDEILTAANDYGWKLSDAEGNSNNFMGVGRRGYITGKIQNVNINVEKPMPWAGYYWSTTSESSTTRATAMYFAIDALDPSGNEIFNSNFYRSNGMQVRCQRDI